MPPHNKLYLAPEAFTPNIQANSPDSIGHSLTYEARIGENPGHFVVVESIKKGIVKYWDPADAIVRKMPLEKFLDIISGIVYR